MTRKLKILMLSVMALGAFGALNAAGAHAAEEKFHCSVEPCRFRLKPDGTGTTAHQVFVVRNTIGESISFTCNELTGEGESATKTTTSVTGTNLVYSTCKTVLGEATIHMNGCTYTVTLSATADNGTITVGCPVGKEIELTNAPCLVDVPPQGPLKGIGISAILNKTPEREVTITAKVPGIKLNVRSANGTCGFDTSKTPITAEITTGNLIGTAESTAGVRADGWWE